MGNVGGQHLYVNLAASQVRKRLKGFGHGVRKVESAGRHQALIIHTATGDHLDELEALFGDVATAHTPEALGEPVENLKNLGAATAAWLRAVGVHTVDDLRRIGPAATYTMVKQQQPQATTNLLWALAGGLQDKDSRQLSEAEKDALLRQAERFESPCRLYEAKQ